MEQSVTARVADYKERTGHRESSAEIFDRAVKWFIRLYGDMDVRQVDFSKIDDFKKWLIKERPRSREDSPIYSPKRSTANSYLRIFKPFWGWLRRRGDIERDPFDGVGLYKVPKIKFVLFKPDEVSRIFRVAGPLWRRIICLGLLGMREAEILNLILSDIDFERNEITVTPKRDTADTWRWDIKDSDQRIIGIDQSVMRLLFVASKQLKIPYLNLKLTYWERNMLRRQAGTLSHRLRNNPWGNFNRDFKDLLSRAGVECSKGRPRRFQDLRGTFATERFRADFDIKEVQILMGHSSVETTMGYLHHIEERDLAARSARTFGKTYATTLLS